VKGGRLAHLISMFSYIDREILECFNEDRRKYKPAIGPKKESKPYLRQNGVIRQNTSMGLGDFTLNELQIGDRVAVRESITKPTISFFGEVIGLYPNFIVVKTKKYQTCINKPAVLSGEYNLLRIV
jgi:hypothetical protein